MRGCRNLSDNEKLALIETLKDPRNRLLFLLGTSTGLRIQELLSINVGDIYQNGSIVQRVYVQRKNFKGKVAGRSVLVNPKLHSLILEVIREKNPTSPLFEGYMGQPMTRVTAWRIIKNAANTLKLTGKIATHSMRKTFAQKVYDNTGKDIIKTAYALGHKDIKNTMQYLSFLTEELDEIILDM